MTISSIPVAAFRYQSDSRDARHDVSLMQQALNGLNRTTFKDLDGSLTGLSKTVGGLLPAISAGAFAAFVTNANRAAIAAGDTAERLSTTVAEFSKVQGAAKAAGVDIGGLEGGLRSFQNTLSEALRGNEAAADAFGAIGLKAEQLKGLKLDEQMALIAKQFKDTVPEVDRTRVAMDLFGKSAGAELIPLLLKGGEGVRQLTEAVVAHDERAVKALDRSAKAWERFKTTLSTGTSNIFGGIVADIAGSGDELLELNLEIERLAAGQEYLRRQIKTLGPGLNNQRANLFDQQSARLEQLRNQSERLRTTGPELINPTGGIEFAKSNAAAIEAQYEASEKRQQEILRESLRKQAADREFYLGLQSARIAETNRNVEAADRESQKELTDNLLEQNRVRTAAIVEAKQAQIEIEYSTNDILSDLVGQHMAFQIDLDKFKNQSLLQNAVQLTGGVLQNNKKLAKQAQALAYAQTIWATAAGIMKAYQEGSWGMVAVVAAAGAVNLAKIRANNFSENGLSGGGGFNAAPPGFQQSPSVDSRIQNNSQADRGAINVIVQGDWLDTQDTARWLMNTLREQFDRDVVIIKNNSAQAQELVPA